MNTNRFPQGLPRVAAIMFAVLLLLASGLSATMQHVAAAGGPVHYSLAAGERNTSAEQQLRIYYLSAQGQNVKVQITADFTTQLNVAVQDAWVFPWSANPAQDAAAWWNFFLTNDKSSPRKAVGMDWLYANGLVANVCGAPSAPPPAQPTVAPQPPPPSGGGGVCTNGSNPPPTNLQILQSVGFNSETELLNWLGIALNENAGSNNYSSGKTYWINYEQCGIVQIEWLTKPDGTHTFFSAVNPTNHRFDGWRHAPEQPFIQVLPGQRAWDSTKDADRSGLPAPDPSRFAQPERWNMDTMTVLHGDKTN